MHSAELNVPQNHVYLFKPQTQIFVVLSLTSAPIVVQYTVFI